MKYDRYFWKSGRNKRKRDAEEKGNLRKVLLVFAAMVLVGFAVGLLFVLLFT